MEYTTKVRIKKEELTFTNEKLRFLLKTVEAFFKVQVRGIKLG